MILDPNLQCKENCPLVNILTMSRCIHFFCLTMLCFGLDVNIFSVRQFNGPYFKVVCQLHIFPQLHYVISIRKCCGFFPSFWQTHFQSFPVLSERCVLTSRPGCVYYQCLELYFWFRLVCYISINNGTDLSTYNYNSTILLHEYLQVINTFLQYIMLE